MAAKMGRPRKEINWEAFDKLCAIQCTLVELAGFFDCSEDTIEARVKETYGMTFSEYFKKKSAPGKMSLRRKQFDLALSGNVTMCIWLGKQYLDQSDKTESAGTPDKPIVLRYAFDDDEESGAAA